MPEYKKVKTFKVEKGDKEVELCVKRPNRAVMDEAELLYTVEVSRAIRKGSMTNSEALAIMSERGMWTDEDEKKAQKIKREIRDREIQLETKTFSKEKGGSVAKEITKLRNDFTQHLSKRNALLNYTAEAHASKLRDHFYTAKCTFYSETGEPYFEDYEDYSNRSSDEDAFAAYREMLYLINDLDPEFLKKQTENQYMINNKIMDEDGYYVNDDGKRVDSKGRRINERFEFVLDIDEEEVRCDEFGNPLNEDGTLNKEMLKKVKPELFED